jgi:D-3-phosphoglycerate dehydrogenase
VANVSLRILIAEPQDFSPQAEAILRSLGEVVRQATDGEGMRRAFGEFDVVWFRLAHRIDAALLGERPHSRILATPVTGLDHIDLAACQVRGVRVVSLKGEVEFLQNVRATAELTIALALALLRQIPDTTQSVRAGVWDRDLFRGHELYSKTVGIVGLGRLGSIVAGYFRAFGMKVIAYDPRPDFPHHLAERVNSLPDLLADSDLVSIHVNYDSTTKHLIAEHEFAAMKPSAILVNTARGGVVEERSLIAALESGRLAGAAVDVLDGEPHINASHPLVAYARSHHNLLITPHIGGNTWESFEKTEVFLAGRVVEAVRQLGLVDATVTEPLSASV